MPAPSEHTVLLTRSDEDCKTWARQLAARGIGSVSLPCITTERIDSAALRAAAARAMDESDWLVFTSRRGVAAFAALTGNGGAGANAPRMPRVPHRPHMPRIATVGPATAEAARAHFGRVDLTGAGTAADLARTLPPALTSAAATTNAPTPLITLALARNAPDLLERALAAVGARCTRLDVYRTIPAPPRHPKQALSELGADNIFLASPSAVTGLVNQVDIDVPAALYAIGPSTAARMRALGLTVAGEAREPSLEGLLEALQCRN